MKEYILYLEPKRNSELFLFLQNYLDISRDCISPTEAHQYHPHCSITGFFHTDSLIEDVIKVIDEYDKSNISIQFGKIEYKEYFKESSLSLSSNYTIDSTLATTTTSPTQKTPSIRLLVKNFGIFALIPLLNEIIPTIRGKPLDHISLASFSSFKNEFSSSSKGEYSIYLSKGDTNSTMIPYRPEDHYLLAKEYFNELKFTLLFSGSLQFSQ